MDTYFVVVPVKSDKSGRSALDDSSGDLESDDDDDSTQWQACRLYQHLTLKATVAIT